MLHYICLERNLFVPARLSSHPAYLQVRHSGHQRACINQAVIARSARRRNHIQDGGVGPRAGRRPSGDFGVGEYRQHVCVGAAFKSALAQLDGKEVARRPGKAESNAKETVAAQYLHQRSTRLVSGSN